MSPIPSTDLRHRASAEDRTFCPHPDCRDENGQPKKHFSRKADVTRHIKSRHDVKYIDCPKSKCERKGRQGFTRRDHLTEHLRGFHNAKLPKRQSINKGNANKKKIRRVSGQLAAKMEIMVADQLAAENVVDHAASHHRPSNLTEQSSPQFKQEQTSPSHPMTPATFSTDDDQYMTAMKRSDSVAGGQGLHETFHPCLQPPGEQISELESFNPSPIQPCYTPEYSPAMVSTHAMTNPYTTGHMVSPVYASHHNPPHYFGDASTMPGRYAGFQALAPVDYGAPYRY
jgi:hypothetical protein